MCFGRQQGQQAREQARHHALPTLSSTPSPSLLSRCCRHPSLPILPGPLPLPAQSLLSEAVEEFISAGTGPAEQQIRNLVACELAYINTSHPQFIGGNRAIAQVRRVDAVARSTPAPGMWVAPLRASREEFRGGSQEAPVRWLGTAHPSPTVCQAATGPAYNPHAVQRCAMLCDAGPALQVLERRGIANDSDEESASPGRRDAGAPPRPKSTSALVAAASGAGAAPRPGGLAAAAKAALRGVEPELYSPEELMGGAAVGAGEGGESGSGSGGGGAGRPGLASIPAAADTTGKGSWFANWFSSRSGPADDAASDSMLSRPPPVRRLRCLRRKHCAQQRASIAPLDAMLQARARAGVQPCQGSQRGGLRHVSAGCRLPGPPSCSVPADAQGAQGRERPGGCAGGGDALAGGVVLRHRAQEPAGERGRAALAAGLAAWPPLAVWGKAVRQVAPLTSLAPPRGCEGEALGVGRTRQQPQCVSPRRPVESARTAHQPAAPRVQARQLCSTLRICAGPCTGRLAAALGRAAVVPAGRFLAALRRPRLRRLCPWGAGRGAQGADALHGERAAARPAAAPHPQAVSRGAV